ncbi:hypothetical protein ERICI_04494 [Paenibacillus larvae subsp. larvae]|uniref:AB hydrolase-1 domain-containing protein n=2 Tax=Paenibacillus larvae TaxID=1464 RepID=A0A6C0QYT3_9BACL|nr:hypothetical protein ERICI_04494 [Paenibacillus larvae subsp. larvae]AVG14297.1 hypothetical protein ERICII_04068 [Paenibacillus larvae subsp. larvae DSM 25430]ETK29003.1 hypothetical protein ERIC1_1c25010 [Paenibacillus larvae subsp. larvae DSM 25719]PCK72599.1 hydrolase-like protein [Paenibacillus larvae subsp. larvae B-3650]QHZ53882.1 hypothetical protein ERICV_04894 [Paenibacillus larvae subsp. larvae]
MLMYSLLTFTLLIIILYSLAYYGFIQVTQMKKMSVDECFAELEHKIGYSRSKLDHMDKEQVEIVSQDGYKLRGWHLKPNENSRKVMIIVHGYTVAHPVSLPFSDMFIEQGFNILVVDQRAHGWSEGKYTTYGYLEKYDLDEWVNWVRKRYDQNCVIGLHGQSLGGATVLEYAAINEHVSFIIADCPYSDLSALIKYQIKIKRAPAFPFYQLVDRLVYKKAGFRLADVKPIETMKQAEIPVMFIHGSLDNFVPTYMSEELYEAKIGKKKLLVVEGASHGNSYAVDKEKYEEEVRMFVEDALIT